VSSAASDLAPKSESFEESARRRSLIVWTVALVAFLLAGALVAVLGTVQYVNAYSDRSAARDSSARAQSYALQVHAREAAARRDRAELKTDLHAAALTRTRLRIARSEGFSGAVAAGGQRGASAGTAAGVRAGTRDGHAQRAEVPAPGWYYAHVGWQGGLPVIDDSYDVRPGASHAYWVESGKAWKRTTG
jgi:hypothetical protein